jgi:hypothetical protein
MVQDSFLKFQTGLGYSQYHLAVAGGCKRSNLAIECVYDVPTRYREVVLTVSNCDSELEAFLILRLRSQQRKINLKSHFD